jgi:apolipoprotein D and lipocalin family protein
MLNRLCSKILAPRLSALLCALLFGFTPGSVSAAPPLPELTPVSPFEFSRYSGEWYEVALIPYWFQRNCLGNAKVRYTPLDNHTYEDYFECDTRKPGRKQVLIGRARVVDPVQPSVLSATFLNLIGWRYWLGRNYWVTDLAPDYRYAVVSHPGRNLGWVLARTPSLPPADWATIIAGLKQQGYNPCRFVYSPHGPLSTLSSGKSTQSVCTVTPGASN